MLFNALSFNKLITHSRLCGNGNQKHYPMTTSAFLLIFFVLTLGLRHGLDLDHIATIDAITRQISHQRRWQKQAGVLFSFGHGLIVLIISLIIGSKFIHLRLLPNWLDSLGKLISIFFLLLFGLLNLYSLFINKSQTNSELRGVKSYLVKKILPGDCRPLLIITIGALFALSFDTVSQVTLFSLSASNSSGWMFSMILGLAFMIGMMITDGINGFMVAAVINKAGYYSVLLSKILGLMIVIFSLGLCGYSLYEFLN